MSATAKKIEEFKIEPLKGSDLQDGVHAYQQYSCRCADDIKPDDLLQKEYWAFVVDRMKIGAEIRIVPNNFAWVCRLIVTFTDGFNIRLKQLSLTNLDDVTPVLMRDKAKNYTLILRGQQKWCVQRLQDGKFIKELIPTKQEAIVWLDKYVLALDGDSDAETFLTELDY